MALTSSGQISIQDIRDEFVNTSSYTENFDLIDFYHADPYAGIPLSGEISLDDFYETNSRTCEIDGGASFDDSWDGDNTDPDPAGRKGFSVVDGSSFYRAEAGESRSPFGTCSRTYGLLSTGQRFTAFFLENTSQTSPSFSGDEKLIMFKRGGGNTSTSAGWDSLKFRLNNVHNSRWFQSSSGLKNLTLYRSHADGFFKGSNTSVNGVSAYAWRWKITGNSGSGDATTDEVGIFRWLRSISHSVTSNTTGYNVYGDGGQGNYAALQFVGGTSPVATQYYKSIQFERTLSGNVTSTIYLYTRMNGTTLEIYARSAQGTTGLSYHTDFTQTGSETGATSSSGLKVAQITNAGSGEWFANISNTGASGPSGYTSAHSTSDNTLAGNIPLPTNSVVINNTALWYDSFPSSVEYKTFKSLAVAQGTQAEPLVNTVKKGSRVTLYLKHKPTASSDSVTTNAHDDIEFEFDIYTMARSTGP